MAARMYDIAAYDIAAVVIITASTSCVYFI